MRKYNEKIIKDWWFGLDEMVKQEIMDVFFPNDIIFDIDNEWRRLDREIKLEIYGENNF